MKKALLIGIDYIGTSHYLSGCIDDIQNSYQFIQSCGYNEVLILSDASHFQPYNSVILKALDWLLSDQPSTNFSLTKEFKPTISPQQLFVHYSGHGAEDCWCPLDAVGSSKLISGNTIQDRLVKRINKNTKLTLLMDCCHSGNMLKLGYSSSVSPISGHIVSENEDGTVEKGIVICLAGCKDNQTSGNINIGGVGEGVLTYSLLKVLGENRRCNYSDLLVAIQKYILDNHLSLQNPVLTYNNKEILDEYFLE